MPSEAVCLFLKPIPHARLSVDVMPTLSCEDAWRESLKEVTVLLGTYVLHQLATIEDKLC